MQFEKKKKSDYPGFYENEDKILSCFISISLKYKNTRNTLLKIELSVKTVSEISMQFEFSKRAFSFHTDLIQEDTNSL